MDNNTLDSLEIRIQAARDAEEMRKHELRRRFAINAISYLITLGVIAAVYLYGMWFGMKDEADNAR